MSDETQPKKKRIRTRSLKMQLALALKDAEIAATSKDTDEYTIARLRLLQTRLKILSVKEARERASKLKAMQAEIASLKAENARLKAELSSRPAAQLDCGEMSQSMTQSMSDEALDKQVAEMLEQLKCGETGNTTPVPPTPAPVRDWRKQAPEPLIFPWRSPDPSPVQSTHHEPGDSAPRLSPTKEEQQALSDLHRDARFSQRSVAERVAKIEAESARLRAIRDQTI